MLPIVPQSVVSDLDIEYDAEKSARCLIERAFDFAYASLVFLGDVVEFEDTRRDYGEVRMIAIGLIDGDLYKVVYTDRGQVRRIISANRASRQEKRIWRSSE